MPAHRSRLALAAHARTNDEIMRAGTDRRHQHIGQVGTIGAVAVEEQDDAAAFARRRHAGGTGAAIASLGSVTTRAPAACAIAAVPSRLELSATMISSTTSRGSIAITPAIVSASLSVGMTAATRVNGGRELTGSTASRTRRTAAAARR